jgi:general secretion pathway protein A
MYLSHYSLVEKPFQITTDPKFLWLGEKHQEALSTLKYGVLDSRGFLLLTGDVGTGKTTLINALLTDLDDSVITATVVDPSLETLEFFRFLARAFGIDDKFTMKVDFLTDFAGFLNRAYENDRKVLLIVDEAQRLSTELLEEIRLLSNIEKEDRKLLNIFFVGQDEFKNTLMGGKCRALRQRIAITHKISPLTPVETTEYIKYRLRVAGAKTTIFERGAVRDIYAFSQGYPRLINIICDHALLTGFVREVKKIDSAIMKECAQELSVPGGRDAASAPLKDQLPKKELEKKHLRRIALYTCLLLVIVFSGYLSMTWGHREYVMNAARYYEKVLGWREVVSPKASDGRNGVPESQHAETSSGSLHMGRIADDEPVAVASNTKIQGRAPVVQQERVPIGSVAGLESAHVGGAIVRNETTHDMGPSSGDLTSMTGGRSGKDFRLSVADVGLLLLAYGKLIIPFHYSSAELSEDAFGVLDRFAAVMILYSDTEIIIKGYTDSSGEPVFNQVLSESRANAVKDYLVAKGLSPLRINTIGMGARSPMESNATVAGRRANRRAEIELHITGRE